MDTVPDMDDLLDSLEDLPEVDKNNDSSRIDRSVKSDDNRLFMDSGSISKSSCFKENVLKIEEEIVSFYLYLFYFRYMKLLFSFRINLKQNLSLIL